MKKIGQFIFNPIVISILGLIIISLLIWFAGPSIKFGATNSAPLASPMTRLMVIMVILVLWGLNNLRIQMRNNRNNQSFVNELEENNKVVQSPSNEQALEEIDQINQRFVQAMETLKKFKFGGKGKNKALYQLPWYIIVGPPGSGKTTALVNSGLDFPMAEQFGRGALQGVGGTRNCDWWFTNEAVLIDTAGRYTTQDSHRVVDSSAWEGFLDLLKRNRRRRPINGVIVAISLQDLLLSSEEERAMHAKTIRTRLDELMNKLEIRFPIYLLFTKTDLVSGFSEFFEDLGKEERDQVWGMSLPNAPKPTQSPDFEFLSNELRTLISRLYDRVLARMHGERDMKRCGAIQGFPQQMENLQTLVESFTKQTFVQNRFQFQPYLRGIYFSSGTQDGTPIDRLMTSVASNFGFSREVAQSSAGRGKSFFISKLFRDVIFPESELVGVNTRYEKMIRWAQIATYIGLGLITLLVILVWSGSVARNKMYIAEVQKYVTEYSEQQKNNTLASSNIKTVVPGMDALLKASSVYDQERHPWLSGMGLYDSRVDHAADLAYENALKKVFLPKLLTNLELNLQQSGNEGDLYNTFRVYMMFNKLDHLDKAVVKSWFDENWNRNFRDDAETREKLHQHFDNLFAKPFPASDLSQPLVEQTRASLLRIPIAQRVYSRIKASSQYSKPVDMLNFYGDSVRSHYRIDERVRTAMRIPVLFTIQGYKNVDLSPSSPLIADFANEQWMMSEGNSIEYTTLDSKEISEQVKALYFAEYNKTWMDIYDSLFVSNFSSLHELSDALNSFVDPVYSPLLSILQVGKLNTQLTPDVPDKIADKVAGAVVGKSAGEQAVNYLESAVERTPVDLRFNELNSLMADSSRAAAPIGTTIQKLSQLKEYVQEISMAPDPAKKSFEIVKARADSGGGNPITSLKGYAKSTPEPIQRWLLSLADQAGGSVGQSGHQFINSAWRSQVCGPFKQTLAGRYPFNRSSSDEAALLDFTAFFKPGGILDQFLKENMQSFVDARGNLLDTRGSGFSPGAIAEIQKAIAIRNTFFRESAEVPGVSFELRPVSMDETDARFTLELGEQRISYTHGPKFWNTLSWTGDKESKRLRVLFEDLRDASFDKIYTGPWVLFHLLDDASIKATGQSNTYSITFSVGGAADDPKTRHKIVYEGRANSVNNPFRRDLLSSFRCPESL
jgi:type VI secretion system protein ImpL